MRSRCLCPSFADGGLCSLLRQSRAFSPSRPACHPQGRFGLDLPAEPSRAQSLLDTGVIAAPARLDAPTTSDANRNPIWISAPRPSGDQACGGIPPWPRARASPRASAAGADILAVSSRTSHLLGQGLLRIGLFLSFVRLAKTDDPKRIAANAVTDHVKPALHRAYASDIRLAITAAGPRHPRRVPIQLRSQLERQSALFGVPRALRRIELNLHT